MKSFSITIALILLAGCSSKPYTTKVSAELPPTGINEIYIVSHGWHTGFVIPAADIETRYPQLKERFDDSPYLEIGWGDKGFYQAQVITTGLAIRAVFWPTESVIHAVAVPSSPEEYFAGSLVQRLCLHDREYSSLIDFISNSFHTSEEGKIKELRNGIYGNSQFYKGTGDYYLMNTCNKWTAKGLKSAGMDISPTFKLTADSIMDYLQEKADENEIKCSQQGILIEEIKFDEQ